jgi:hypothetical protein
LVEEETYLTEVSAVYSTGESEKRSFLWTYYGCEYFAGPENLTTEVNGQDVTLNWDEVVPLLSGFDDTESLIRKSNSANRDMHARDGNNTAVARQLNSETDADADIRTVEMGREMWDLLYDFDIDTPTGLTGLAGAESDGEFIYATKWNGSEIVKFNMDGNFIETFTIPGVTGLRDLAFDGTYMYGAAAATTVYKMDFNTQTLVSSFTAPTAVRAIAYDADNDAFWGNNWSTDMVLFDETGATLNTLTEMPSMFGAAYDNFSIGGPYLWFFTGTTTGGGCQVEQYSISTGTPTGVSHSVSTDFGDVIAGGLYIVEDLVNDKVIIGGTAQGTPDLAFGYELLDNGEFDALLGTNIYRDGELIAEMVLGNNYVDENVALGNHNYCVTHVYESGGESCPEDACIEVLVAENCKPPQSLTATYNETNHGIDLTWETNVIEEWLFYDDGTNVDGIGGPASFSWAVKFDPDQLAEYDGASLTKIAIYNRTAATDELRIYEGANAANLLYSQSLNVLAVEAWAEVELTDAILIDVTKELWITVYTTDGVNYPAGCGPTQEAPNGDLITLDGVLWEHLSVNGLPFTWNLRGFVTNMAGATKALAPLDKPVAYPSAGQQQLLAISHQGFGSNNKIVVDGQRAMTHFQVYRNVNGGNFEVIDEVPFDENQTEYVYSDASISNSAETYCYFITANYEYCGESDQSNEACVTIDPVCSPGWEPVPNLQYNMQLIGQIMIDDLVSLDANDIVGAFVGDECRGIASPMPDFNGLVFLSIGSNVASGEEVVLKIWNSNTCAECDAGPTVTFENMAEIGSIDNPAAIACITDVDLTLSFGQGYTWFSENLAPEDAHPNSMFDGLEACNNDRLIGQSNFSVYYNGSWNGTITAMNPFYSYRMKLCEAQEFTATAPAVEITPISLNAGYTWLGYLPQACLAVNDALANLSPAPTANDRLIGQSSFALFTGTEWIGSLTTLCPGEGYVIKLANASALTYPEASANSTMNKLMGAEADSPIGVLPEKNLQHSMTVLGQIELASGQYSSNTNDRIYAYINDRCVGMANPMETKNGLIFLSIGENSDESQEVSFKIWLDEEQQLYDAKETIAFVPLKGEGVFDSPFKFTIGEPANDNNNFFIGNAFPNPFNNKTIVPLRLSEEADVSIELRNSVGQLVFTDKFHMQAGFQQYHLINRAYGTGLYHLSITLTSNKTVIQSSQKLSIN